MGGHACSPTTLGDPEESGKEEQAAAEKVVTKEAFLGEWIAQLPSSLPQPEVTEWVGTSTGWSEAILLQALKGKMEIRLLKHKHQILKTNTYTYTYTQRCHFTPTVVAEIKRTHQEKDWPACEEPEASFFAGGNVKWCDQFGKQFVSDSKC